MMRLWSLPVIAIVLPVAALQETQIFCFISSFLFVCICACIYLLSSLFRFLHTGQNKTWTIRLFFDILSLSPILFTCSLKSYLQLSMLSKNVSACFFCSASVLYIINPRFAQEGNWHFSYGRIELLKDKKHGNDTDNRVLESCYF